MLIQVNEKKNYEIQVPCFIWKFRSYVQFTKIHLRNNKKVLTQISTRDITSILTFTIITMLIGYSTCTVRYIYKMKILYVTVHVIY